MDATTSPSKQVRAAEVKDRVRVQFAKEREEKGGANKLSATPNPFVYDGPLWTPRQVGLVFCGIVVVPLRLLCFMILSFWGWAFLKLSISGDFDPEKPMTGWRRAMQYPVAYMVRILMFVLGFYWVETVGKPCSNKEARIVVAAPHSTIFDTLYLIYVYRCPSAISKIENLQLPLAGTSFKAMQAIAVDRKSRDAKDQAVIRLQKHAADVTQRHLLVFPEGTCTNRKALITFKRGAFATGQPVQPVCLEWPWTGFDLTWTAGGPSRLALAFHALCQPILKLKVTFLPVYKPSEEEQQNHGLYARNVRALMAETLKIPCTGHSYEDMFLAKEARKLRFPLDSNVPFELHELSTLFSISLDDAKSLMKRYASIYKNSERVDGPGLAKILGIPYTAPVKELFELLRDDADLRTSSSGATPGAQEGINFKELLVGIAQLSKALNTADVDSSIELVWEAVSDGQQEITERQLYERLSNVFSGFKRLDSKKIFRNADAEKRGKVDHETFKAFIKDRPELLFVAVETIAQRPKGRRLSVLAKQQEAGGKTSSPAKHQTTEAVAPVADVAMDAPGATSQ